MKKLIFKTILCLLVAVVPIALFGACSCKKEGNQTSKASIFQFEKTADGNYFLKKYNGKAKIVEIPSTYNGKNVVKIGSSAFAYNEYVMNVKIPSTVKTIGISAFECTKLEEITISASVEIIEDSAFAYCVSLENVEFESGSALNTIKQNAFSYCYALQQFVLPSSVTEIGNNAFYGCTNLETISVESGNTVFDSREDCNAIIKTANNELVVGTKNTVMLDSVAAIGDFAFYGVNKTFPHDFIPSSVVSIGKSAFERASFESVGEKDLRFATVNIPASVKTIGESAFDGSNIQVVEFASECGLLTIGQKAFANSSLNDITIPKSVTEIGSNAFNGCESLSEVNFESGTKIKKIKNYVFSNTGISSITIPSSVTEIGDSAFSDCENLSSIIFAQGNALKSIGSSAFYACSSLSGELTFPSSLNSVGESAFSGCNSLTGISLENCQITEIKSSTFSGCSSLLRIKLPSAVTKIGYDAFHFCKKLTTFTIPSSVTEIGSNAFYDCDSLTEISIPALVETIDSSAFYDCANLVSVNFLTEKLETIPDRLFYCCNSLTTVNIPESVKTIEDGAFEQCVSLVSITIPASVTTFGSNIFNDCDSLENIYINSTNSEIAAEILQHINDCSVGEYISVTVFVTEDVYDYVFSNYEGISPIHISFNNLPENLFNFVLNAGDQSYTITGYKSTKIMNVVVSSEILGKPVTAIAENAFKNTAITSITIPSSVSSIGENAFDGCTKLAKITIESENDEVFASTLATINSYDFNGNVYVWNVMKPAATAFKTENGAQWEVCDIDDTMFNFGKDKNGNYCICGLSDNYSGDGNLYIPATHNGKPIVSIAGSAFSWNENIFSVKFSPKSYVKTISESAFGYCENLTSFELPSNLEIIEDSAFSSTALKQIYIPESVSYIHSSAFRDCSHLESIEVSAQNESYDSRENCNAIIDSEGNKFILTCKNTTIPLSVTEIPDGMLKGASITTFTIPRHITKIGNSAFSGCSSLQSIIFEEGSLLQEIGKDAFSFCTSLSSIVLPSGVKIIGDGAFYFCASLNSITLNNGLEEIGESVFKYCNSLTSFVVPASVKVLTANSFSGLNGGTSITIDANSPYFALSNGCLVNKQTKTLISVFGSLNSNTIPADIKIIGSGVFEGSSISSITLPQSLEIIGPSAFYGCSNLTIITIPASVKIIGKEAFYNCTNLTSITIPSSVVSIEEGAFASCVRLSEVTFEKGGNLFSIKSNAFGKTAITSLNLPEGLVELGANAFFECNSLESVVLPSTLTVMSDEFGGEDPFCGCNNLATATVYVRDENCLKNRIAAPDKSKGIGYYLSINSGTMYVWEDLVESVTSWFGKNSQFVTVSPITVESIVKLIANNDQNPTYYKVRVKDVSNQAAEITFPEIYNGLPVTTVVGSAFKGCKNLVKIVLPESITTIEGSAFKDCSALLSVEIPSSVQSIASDAFLNCTSLREITIPAQITNIFKLGLETCTALKKIILNTTDVENAKTLCYYISKFPNDSTFNLQNLEIYIHASIFDEVNEFVSVNYPSLNLCKSYSLKQLESEWAFNMKTDGTFSVSYVGNESEVFVPGEYCGAPVTEIREYAFQNNRNITKIVLPETITSIGRYAFSSCDNLKTIDFSACTLLNNIGMAAFDACGALETADFSACTALEKIADCAFQGCCSLKTVILPEGLKTIGSAAFYNTVITEITIPASVTEIGEMLFSKCGALKTVSVAVENEKYYADGNCIIESASKKVVSGCAASVLPSDIEVIGKRAFNEVTTLKTISFPATLKRIEAQAFYSCSALTTVDLSACNSLSFIGKEAFNGCSALTTVILPEGLKRIDSAAFAQCNNLNEINIPSTVISFGADELDAFVISSYSNNITVIIDSLNTDFVVNNILPRIECKYVLVWEEVYAAAVQYTTDNPYFGWDYSPIFEVLLNFSLERAFSWDLSEEYAVATEYLSIANEIELPVYYNEKPIRFAANALSGAAVNKITITSEEQADVVALALSIESAGFVGTICVWDSVFGSVDEAITSTDITVIRIDDSDFTFELDTETNTYVITAYNSKNGNKNVFVPSTHLGKPVSKIVKNAFAWNNNIVSLSFSTKSVLTEIGENAFDCCQKLESVNLPTSIVTIGVRAFCGCDKLSNINFGSCSNLTTIGMAAFGRCYALESVSLPSSVTTIGQDAFQDCTSLNSVTMAGGGNDVYDNPEGSNLIIQKSNDSFVVCGNEIVIPNSYNAIAEEAFKDVKIITKVTIPSSVQSIGNSAFEGCINLETVIFAAESSLNSIGEKAFYGCSKLKNIVIPAGVTTIGNKAFYGVVSFEFENGGNESYSCERGTNIILGSEGNIVAAGQEIIIPSLMEIVPASAFYDYDCLNKVTIPATVTKIGVSAFYDCGSLETVVFEEGSLLNEIAGWAFFGCSKLTQIGLPQMLVTIGESAFEGCSVAYNWLIFTFPATLKYIGQNAFKNSYLGSATYTIGSQIEFVGEGAFEGCDYQDQFKLAVFVENADIYNADYDQTTEGDALARIIREWAVDVYVLKSIVDDENNSNDYLNDPTVFSKESGTSNYSNYYKYHYLNYWRLQ